MIERRTFRLNCCDTGIVYVSVGKPYANVADAVIAQTLKVLPDTSITLLLCEPEKDDPVWTVRKAFEMRALMWYLTPYKKTLCLDLDSVVHGVGILSILDYLDTNDIVLRPINERSNMKLSGEPHYAWIDRVLGYSTPCPIPTGGFWAFRKTSQSKNFFDLWYTAWVRTGRYSDMPCIAWTAQNTKAEVFYDLDAGWENHYCERWSVDGKLVFEQTNGGSVDCEYAELWYKTMKHPESPEVFEGVFEPPGYARGFEEQPLSLRKG